MKKLKTIMPNNLKRGEWFMNGHECAIGFCGRNQKSFEIFLELWRPALFSLQTVNPQ